MIAHSAIISGSTGPIFTIFHQMIGRPYLFVDDRSGTLFFNSRFLIPQGTSGWQLILDKIGKMTFIWQAGVPKRIRIWQFRFKNIQWQYCRYTVCMIKIGPVTPEFVRVRTAHFWTRWQNRHIPLNMLATTGPIFTRLSV